MTWPITPQLRKLLSEISGCDTLSLGEGRGEASNWLYKFAYKQHLSMAEGRYEAKSNARQELIAQLINNQCYTKYINPIILKY